MKSKVFNNMYDSYENLLEDYPHLESIEKLLEDSIDEEDEKIPFKSKSKFQLITKRIDCPKIQHKKEIGFNVNVSTCQKMSLSAEGNVRSGAIIYTHYQGRTYFCLGVDSDYGDLTDFAGGVKKTDLDQNEKPCVVVGGLRELHEESLGVFGLLTPESVANDLVFWTNNMAIMFIKLNVIPEEVNSKFKQSYSEHHDSKSLEVSNIKWLCLEDFKDSIMCRGQRMYSRVRKILSRVTPIIEAL